MDWKVNIDISYVDVLVVLNVLLLYYVKVSAHTRPSARMHEYEVTVISPRPGLQRKVQV